MNNREILAIFVITAIIQGYLMLTCFNDRFRYLMYISFLSKITARATTVIFASAGKTGFFFIYNEQRAPRCLSGRFNIELINLRRFYE